MKGDIFKASKDNIGAETEKGGIIFGAGINGQRINLNTDQSANQFGSGATSYVSETAEDDGARNGAISFIKAGQNFGGGYVVTPKVQGPARITIWNAAGVTDDQGVNVYINNSGTFDFLQAFTIPGGKVIKKNSFVYDGTDEFQVKIEMTTDDGYNNQNCYLYDIVIESTAPPTTPSIYLSSDVATTLQSIYLGQPLTDISYRWAGTANSASVNWEGTSSATTAPAGVTVKTNAWERTLTISGTPTAGGVYNYSVTSSDGTNTSQALTGTLTVKDTDKKKMAYVTSVTSGQPSSLDEPFINALQKAFDVNIISANTKGVDYSFYDILVLSAVPSSGSSGLSELKEASITKPFLNMKTYQMQSSRWDWITGQANTVQTTIVVPDGAKSHRIFDGITFTGDAANEIVVTTKTEGNCVVKFESWSNASVTPIVLATAKDEGETAISYAEVPQGTVLNGMTNPTQAPQIVLGLSESAWDGLTEDAVKLAVNAAYYLSNIPLGITPEKVDNTNKTVVDRQYYDLLGKPVTSVLNGILIEKSVYEDGSVSFKKVYKKNY
ncbi:MAG: Ig domain-containing protein [Dysgonomonas sp.]